MEGENPTRRYKWFRPRQAARGFAIVQPTNYAAVGLFNNSTGPQYLVVRAMRIYDDTGVLFAQDYNLRGHLTSISQTSIPIVSSTPQIPGQVYYDDLAAFPDNTGYQFDGPKDTDVYWEQPFPLAVIEPNWSYVVVNATTGDVTQVAFIWEAVDPDELDFLY